MLMQSYDFLQLFDKYDCTMQLGGDDQWSNIIAGVNLVRKMRKEEVYGMTFTLLATKEGNKMGKTEKGAVWLDAEKTSPYEFFQYWRNVADEDVINSLKLITFIPIEEIERMESWQGSELNKAKEILAFELTKLVHGEEEAQKALDAARAIFQSGTHDKNMPSTKLEESDFTDDEIGLLNLLVLLNLCTSNGEARRLVQQGGVSIDDVKINDARHIVKKSDFNNDGFIIIRKGKKVYHKVLI